MASVLFFVLIAVLCSQVAGGKVSNFHYSDSELVKPSKYSMTVQFPKKIGQIKKKERLIIVFNLTIVKGQTLHMSLPVGDSKNKIKSCSTSFHFNDSHIKIKPNDLEMDEELGEYDLLGKSNMELYIEQVIRGPFFRISVSGQSSEASLNYKQHVDNCKYVNIANINQVHLSGFKRLNSMLFKYERFE